MAKVFLGVGHGGADPGAVANGVKEKDLNLEIALACRDELVRHGVTVQMSRSGDEDDTLEEEIKECNAFNPELAIDIHNNAGGGDGVEAYYYHGGGMSKTLADNVLSEIVKIGQNSRGAKVKLNSRGTDWFGFIRQTKAPAVLLECAFVDNKTDLAIIGTAAKRTAMGIAVARGILKTLGIVYVAPVKKEPEKPKEEAAAPNGVLYVGDFTSRVEIGMVELFISRGGHTCEVVPCGEKWGVLVTALAPGKTVAQLKQALMDWAGIYSCDPASKK